MKIGALVKRHIGQIFAHCDLVEHGEIYLLLDPQYSKRAFGINFPFCIELEHLSLEQSKRYWTEVYIVRGKRVRVTSQWFETSRSLFLQYLASKSISPDLDEALAPSSLQPALPASKQTQVHSAPRRANSRYRGNPIGNAQNAFIRTILSNLGQEAFSEKDWEQTKQYFSHRCAYCGSEGVLLIEHAIPINKERLGEHRLGNLIPSCPVCNSAKGNTDFRTFLADNSTAIARIEAYMDSRNYVPLEDNEQMKMILNMAHREVALLADRYITILNGFFGQGSSSKHESIAVQSGQELDNATPQQDSGDFESGE